MLDETRKQEKRERILEAAARVFAMRGYNRTLIANIAAQAGVGKGTVYEYFDSKADLFFAVFEWFNDQLATKALVQIQDLEGPAAKRLKVLINSLTSAFVEIEDLYSLVMEFWAATASSDMRRRLGEEFRRIYDDYRRLIAGLIQEGITRGEFRSDLNVESVAAGLVGALDGIFLQAWFDDNIAPVPLARNFLDSVIRGLLFRTEGGEG
ncbi:MAG: TetR/AcrR family transcriptional regulator [Deltaproteobacteria bacterium]|nr:MAG: TetR/AcrR family transcriptional regulator [Deltaproteobacteria bacterium]